MKDLYLLLPFFVIALVGIVVGPIEDNWIITGISIAVISIVIIVFLFNRKEYLTFSFMKREERNEKRRKK